MILRSFKLDHVYSGQLNLSNEGNFSFSCFSFSMQVHECVYVLHKSSMYVNKCIIRSMMHVKTFLIKKKKQLFFHGFSSLLFSLEWVTLNLLFQKEFWLHMIKENYWYANDLNHSRTEAKYLGDVLFVLIVRENFETSLYLPLIKYVRESHIG